MEVVAGEFVGVKGVASTFTPMDMYNIRLKAGGAITFNLPEHYNTGILVLDGNVRVNDTHDAPQDNFVLFKNDGEEIQLSSTEGALVLVLSGEPIREPIVGYGPFLMNSEKEIIQAFNDLNTGKFGELED